jgi:hypothetical protein
MPEETYSTITFSDGQPTIRLQTGSQKAEGSGRKSFSNSVMHNMFAIQESDETEQTPSSGQFCFPVWTKGSVDDVQFSYHNRVRLASGEALLVDTGCIEAIAGSEFVERVATSAMKAGRGSEYHPLSSHVQIEGVGSGASTCTREAYLPIAMEDGLTSVHRTKEVPQSNLPGLVGLEVMDRRKVLLDIVHNKFIEVGAGGFTLNLSPGSRVLHMKRAPTGHLMLPCTEWNKAVKADKHVYLQE